MTGRTWTFSVEGKPRPKGSLKCLGGGRGRPHTMVEQVEGSRPWKLAMIRTIRHDFGIEPVKRGNLVIGWTVGEERWVPIAGPVKVMAAFAFARERGVAGEVLPSHAGCWPVAEDIGDLDKLCRNLGDALQQSGLIAEDRNIVGWDAEKYWTLAEAGVSVEMSEL